MKAMHAMIVTQMGKKTTMIKRSTLLFLIFIFNTQPVDGQVFKDQQKVK